MCKKCVRVAKYKEDIKYKTLQKGTSINHETKQDILFRCRINRFHGISLEISAFDKWIVRRVVCVCVYVVCFNRKLSSEGVSFFEGKNKCKCCSFILA